MDPKDLQNPQATSQAQADTDSLLGIKPTVPQATEHRTIARDIAKLIKANKLSSADLKALDKDLRAEAIAFAETLEEESDAPLTIRKQSLTETKPIDRGPKLRPTPPPLPKVEIKPEVKPQPIKLKIEPKPVPPPPIVEDPSKPTLQSIVKSQPIAKPEPPPEQTVKKPEAPLHASAFVISGKGEEEIRLSMNDIATRKEVLEKDLRGLQSEKNDLIHAIEATKNKEKDVEEEEMRIRRELKETSAEANKKVLEEKRWSLEDMRQALEKERWELKQKENSLDSKIQEKSREQNDLASKQKETEEALKKFMVKEEAEKARTILAEQQALRDAIIEKKKKYESDWSQLGSVIQTLTTQMEGKKIARDKANTAFEDIEKRERTTDDDRERHKLEEERWKADKELRDTEKEIWAMEDEMNKKLEEKKELEQIFASIQIEEEDILEKLAESQAVIQKAESLR